MSIAGSVLFASLACCLVLQGGVVWSQPVHAKPSLPPEVSGLINGKPARFVAEGDDILLTTAEAARVGIDYRQAKTVLIGPIVLWQVRLSSVVVGERVRRDVPAGVVVSIAAYIEALQRHQVAASGYSRETRIEINGKTVRAFDLGIGGILVPIDEAERVRIRYREEGKRNDIGEAQAWIVVVPIKMSEKEPVMLPITVAEPRAYFRAMQAKMNEALRSRKQ